MIVTYDSTSLVMKTVLIQQLEQDLVSKSNTKN